MSNAATLYAGKSTKSMSEWQWELAWRCMHEAHERRLMANHGMEYAQAHERANHVEKQLRLQAMNQQGFSEIGGSDVEKSAGKGGPREAAPVSAAPDDTRALADEYASLWNVYVQAGMPPSEHEITEVDAELEGSPWKLQQDAEGFWSVVPMRDEVTTVQQFARHRSFVLQFAAMRAPWGTRQQPFTVSGSGKGYLKGQFIPGEVVAGLKQRAESGDPQAQQQVAQLESAAAGHEATRQKNVQARQQRDLSKLKGRLETHAQSQPLDAGMEKTAARSFRALQRYHDGLVTHRLDELSEQVESRLAKVDRDLARTAEGTQAHSKLLETRQKLQGQMAKFHRVHQLAEAAGQQQPQVQTQGKEVQQQQPEVKTQPKPQPQQATTEPEKPQAEATPEKPQPALPTEKQPQPTTDPLRTALGKGPLAYNQLRKTLTDAGYSEDQAFDKIQDMRQKGELVQDVDTDGNTVYKLNEPEPKQQAPAVAKPTPAPESPQQPVETKPAVPASQEPTPAAKQPEAKPVESPTTTAKEESSHPLLSSLSAKHPRSLKKIAAAAGLDKAEAAKQLRELVKSGKVKIESGDEGDRYILSEQKPATAAPAKELPVKPAEPEAKAAPPARTPPPPKPASQPPTPPAKKLSTNPAEVHKKAQEYQMSPERLHDLETFAKMREKRGDTAGAQEYRQKAEQLRNWLREHNRLPQGEEYNPGVHEREKPSSEGMNRLADVIAGKKHAPEPERPILLQTLSPAARQVVEQEQAAEGGKERGRGRPGKNRILKAAQQLSQMKAQLATKNPALDRMPEASEEEPEPEKITLRQRLQQLVPQIETAIANRDLATLKKLKFQRELLWNVLQFIRGA